MTSAWGSRPLRGRRSPRAEESHMDRRTLIAQMFVLLPLFASGACAGTAAEARPDPSFRLVAMGPMHGDVSCATPSRSARPAPRAAAQLPDQLLHDPAERFALVERLRTHIVARTHAVPNERYWNELRPIL